MKKIITPFLFLLLTTCSPKLGSTILKQLPPLSKNELIVVLDTLDNQTITEEKVGEIKATDSGLSNNCSYYENVLNLKELARQSGANLIKITKYKPPGQLSTCHRLWATIYKVDNVKKYETEIEWSSNRKLTYEDFKGTPDKKEFPNALAVTNSGFGFESSSINLFKDGKLFVQAVFYTNTSWFLPDEKKEYVLRHEQIHFDITEIYSRMLRKALADANITANNSIRATPIFNEISAKWQERQDYYDRDTQRGNRKEKQEKWEATIELELAKYDLYKSN